MKYFSGIPLRDRTILQGHKIFVSSILTSRRYKAAIKLCQKLRACYSSWSNFLATPFHIKLIFIIFIRILFSKTRSSWFCQFFEIFVKLLAFLSNKHTMVVNT